MAANRLGRINDELQRELSAAIRTLKDPRVQNCMISVTAVRATPDLRYAKVWLSVLGLENEKEFRRGLKSAAGWLRHELGQSLELRYTPELVFEVDHSIEYGAHISQVIQSLDIKPDGDESDER